LKNTLANTFPAGYITESVTSVTLANNTAKTQDVTVPDDTVWAVQSMQMGNPDNVARACYIKIYKTSSKTIKLLDLVSHGAVAAGSALIYPNLDTGSYNKACNLGYPLVLKAGYTIEFTWAAGGASAGGTDADGQVIMYRSKSLT